jgi:hypothetical protein
MPREKITAKGSNHEAASATGSGIRRVVSPTTALGVLPAPHAPYVVRVKFTFRRGLNRPRVGDDEPFLGIHAEDVRPVLSGRRSRLRQPRYDLRQDRLGQARLPLGERRHPESGRARRASRAARRTEQAASSKREGRRARCKSRILSCGANVATKRPRLLFPDRRLSGLRLRRRRVKDAGVGLGGGARLARARLTYGAYCRRQRRRVSTANGWSMTVGAKHFRIAVRAYPRVCLVVLLPIYRYSRA